MCDGAAAQGRLHLRELLLGQPRFAPGAPRGTQRGAAAVMPLLIPTADALPAHRQGVRDLRLALTAGKALRCISSTQLQRAKISAWTSFGWHPLILHHTPENVTVLCETQ